MEFTSPNEKDSVQKYCIYGTKMTATETDIFQGLFDNIINFTPICDHFYVFQDNQ